MTVGHLDMPPSLQRSEQHEQIGGTVALILVVVASWLAWLCRNWDTRFLDELLRRLVQANDGSIRIMGPLVNLQDVLHRSYEGGVGLRRDDPLLLEVRLENVFLSVRPIVLSLARSTMFSCTTAVSSIVSVHRLRPFGGGEQASAISLASATPSKMRFLAELGECLRVRAASRPPSTSCWRVRAIVSTLVSSASAISPSLQAAPPLRGIGLQQDARLQHLPRGTCALLYQRVEAFPLSATMYLFTAGCFAITTHLQVTGDMDSEIGRRINDAEH